MSTVVATGDAVTAKSLKTLILCDRETGGLGTGQEVFMVLALLQLVG